MHGFYIEHRTLPEGTPLSKDLAQHIFTRGARGAVVVASKKPQDLASVTKPQWHAMIRMVQRERSSTLKLARIAELSNQARWMERLIFTAKPQEELLDNTVVFTTVSNLVCNPPICSTLYLMQDVTDEQFHLMTSWLPDTCVVIIYEQAP